MKSVRAAYVVTLSMIVLAVSAAPAAATTPVLASDKYKWFYWLGFILAFSLI